MDRITRVPQAASTRGHLEELEVGKYIGSPTYWGSYISTEHPRKGITSCVTTRRVKWTKKSSFKNIKIKNIKIKVDKQLK